MFAWKRVVCRNGCDVMAASAWEMGCTGKGPNERPIHTMVAFGGCQVSFGPLEMGAGTHSSIVPAYSYIIGCILWVYCLFFFCQSYKNTIKKLSGFSRIFRINALNK